MAPKNTKKMGTDPHPFLLPIDDVCQQLGTNIENGLSAKKVSELQKEYPPNELEGGGSVEWYKILIKQLVNAMILVSLLSLFVTAHCYKQWLFISQTAICED
jgi:magnesium-transporting ATPase (P-type)